MDIPFWLSNKAKVFIKDLKRLAKKCYNIAVSPNVISWSTIGVKRQEGATITEALWHACYSFGKPKMLQWDNIKEMKNGILKALLKLNRIYHRLIARYRPRANGGVAQTNPNVEAILKTLLNGASDTKYLVCWMDSTVSLLFGWFCNVFSLFEDSGTEKKPRWNSGTSPEGHILVRHAAHSWPWTTLMH